MIQAVRIGLLSLVLCIAVPALQAAEPIQVAVTTEVSVSPLHAWQEGQGFTIRLHRGAEPMSPFNRSEFRYHMQPMNNGNTRVTLGILVLMPLGSVGEQLAGSVSVLPASSE